MAWRPIETAPKDGTVILAGSAKGVNLARLIGGEWCCVMNGKATFENYGEEPVEPQPTHWMPVPEPPAIGDRNGNRQDREDGLGPQG